MIWDRTDIDPSIVRSIASRFDTDLLTASILVRRGITDFEELKYYFEDDIYYMHNPFLFVKMEDAVKRIHEAADKGEKVKIFGDRDVDGITSTVLIKDALKELGIKASWALPSGDDPYGLTIKAVDKFAGQGGTLFITVDCGISNIEEISYAKEKGIDTIVIDHHNPNEKLPPASVIINPKLEDSGYPFRDLAGCGVVSKVIWALRFSNNSLYNKPVSLINCKPGNKTIILEAVKLINFIEVDRVTENLVTGMVNIENTRLAGFFNEQTIVYNKHIQERMLVEIFKDATEINMYDIGPDIWKRFPALKEKSLLRIREESRIIRYSKKPVEEIDVLKNLFKLFIFKNDKNLSDDFKQELDLVALGTLADLMPIKDENRILVRQGMETLNNTKRKGLRELIIQQKLTVKKITTTDVGWQISPAINSTGRLGVPETAACLLMEENEQESRSLAEEVLALNKKRRKIGDDIWKRVLPEAKISFQDLDGKFVVTGNKNINRGVTGLIASRLVNYFKVPVIVLAFFDDKAVGSIRSIKKFNVKYFLEKFSDLFIDFGGHDYAAGFSLKNKNYPEFKSRITEAVKKMKTIEVTEESIKIDAELPLSYLTPDLNHIVERFEPYGENNPPIIFLAKRLKIIDIDLMGKNGQQHVRITFDSGKHKWPAVFWNAAEKAGRDFSLNDKVDIVFRLCKNYFQNKEHLQLTILDIKR